tara:strand:+ start:310 stop:423 length:114 start_codon:yes stop_codon:yes gene_type:complete
MKEETIAALVMIFLAGILIGIYIATQIEKDINKRTKK